MVKVEYIDILPEQADLFNKNLQVADRFVHGRVVKKFAFYSRKRKAGLSQKSLLPYCSDLWAGLTDEEKNAWGSAGSVCGLNGWRLFVQDVCSRVYNDLSGVATPSLLHQSWIGKLHIESPANEIKIAQLHPSSYYVSRKVTGKKGMYEPVKVQEPFSLPLEISLNYSSNLTAIDTDAFAKFYALVWRSYQGVDYLQPLEINLDLFTDWKTDSAILNYVIGQKISYNLFFHLYNVVGDFYFDNVKAIHSGQNWVRDPFCKDILQGFTRAFYQIPQNWAGVIVPNGSYYDSVYKDF